MGVAGVAERTTYIGLYTWQDGADYYNHVQLDYNWQTIDGTLLKKTWGTAGDQATLIKFGGWGTTVVAATTIMASSRIGTADSNDRYAVTIGGSHTWGNGTAASDLNLYRSGAATLKTSGSVEASSFLAQGGIITNRALAAVSTTGFGISVTGDTNDRLAINAGGTIELGPGNAVFDTNLYRSAANTLKTDDSLIVAGAGLDVSGSATVTGATKLGSSLAFFGTAPISKITGYNITNLTTDRTYDANSTTINELADILGTLINDLKSYGLIG